MPFVMPLRLKYVTDGALSLHPVFLYFVWQHLAYLFLRVEALARVVMVEDTQAFILASSLWSE